MYVTIRVSSISTTCQRTSDSPKCVSLYACVCTAESCQCHPQSMVAVVAPRVLLLFSLARGWNFELGRFSLRAYLYHVTLAVCVHPHSWSFSIPILQNLAILVMIFRHKASNTDYFSMYLKGGAHVKPERSLLWPFASLALRASQVIIDG